MNTHRDKTGFTLIEILVTVGIIAVLTCITISVATRIDSQAREKLLVNTFALLDAALEQFADFKYQYKYPDYQNFDFPLDCNDSGLPPADILAGTLQNEFSTVPVISGGTHDPNYSSSEALYLFLSRVPECRQTLDKIDGSLITSLGTDNVPMTISIDGRNYPLLRIVDPWGTALFYDYYDELALTLADMELSKRNFPLIISAGPDRRFGTGDDMTNR